MAGFVLRPCGPHEAWCQDVALPWIWCDYIRLGRSTAWTKLCARMGVTLQVFVDDASVEKHGPHNEVLHDIVYSARRLRGTIENDMQCQLAWDKGGVAASNDQLGKHIARALG